MPINSSLPRRSYKLLLVIALSSLLLALAILFFADGCATVPVVPSTQLGLSEDASEGHDLIMLSPTSEGGTGVENTGPPTSAPTISALPARTSVPMPSPTPAFRFVAGAFAPLDPVERAEIEEPRTFDPLDRPIFSDTLWVGLYGTPGGRGLGILGRYSATDTVTLAMRQAISYQVLVSETGVSVTPFFHMVTTIADPFPGADADYVHRVATDTLSLWIDVAQRYGLVSVLDIQPGHSPLTQELRYLEPFLRRRDVHLAVDPEFLMVDEAAIPGARIGSMSGRLLNATQSWLSDLAEAVGTRKVLIIHQFDNRMFSDKDVIEDYPWVELVWDADGFGSPGSKIADYKQYAEEPGFEHGGFKLFYNYDTPVMTPVQVVGLEPFPVFVVYQ